MLQKHNIIMSSIKNTIFIHTDSHYPSNNCRMSALAAEPGESNVTVHKTWDSPLRNIADPCRGLKVSTSHVMSLN